MYTKRFRLDLRDSEGPNYSGVSVGAGVNVGTSIVGREVGGGKVSVAVEV